MMNPMLARTRIFLVGFLATLVLTTICTIVIIKCFIAPRDNAVSSFLSVQYDDALSELILCYEKQRNADGELTALDRLIKIREPQLSETANGSRKADLGNLYARRWLVNRQLGKVEAAKADYERVLMILGPKYRKLGEDGLTELVEEYTKVGLGESADLTKLRRLQDQLDH